MPVNFSGGGPVPYRPEPAPATRQRREAETILRSIPGVEGVGEGRDHLGDPAWIAYVRDSFSASKLPSFVANRPVVAETSGEIGILPASGP